MEIDAFILVGGRSRRFGEDKASLQFKGESLIGRTAATIQKAVSPPRITLVAANAEQLVSLSTTLPFVFDIYRGRGPFGAVHAALANSRVDWAFIVACDFPFISCELIHRLAGLISEDIDAVAPVQPDGKTQPLCALYRAKPCLAAVEEFLARDCPSPPVRAILEQVRTRFVQFDELVYLPGSANFFLNMNTPEDYETAIGLAQSRLI
jgi:molybdopterin-guanine dinucleotide biosynthesis protein A